MDRFLKAFKTKAIPSECVLLVFKLTYFLLVGKIKKFFWKIHIVFICNTFLFGVKSEIPFYRKSFHIRHVNTK
jgi:hypothetical protein